MRDRNVRACIGSFTPLGSGLEPAIPILAGDIVSDDIRSRPLSEQEMDTLSIVLSFVGPLREIEDPYTIDFSTEGLYAVTHGKGRVLLPGESKTLDYGLKHILRINPSKGAVRYAAFRVVSFDERRYGSPGIGNRELGNGKE
jgi:hypothetical protein